MNMITQQEAPRISEVIENALFESGARMMYFHTQFTEQPKHKIVHMTVQFRVQGGDVDKLRDALTRPYVHIGFALAKICRPKITAFLTVGEETQITLRLE